jgi:RNA polymerase sigma factor (TIGR02999 family)
VPEPGEITQLLNGASGDRERLADLVYAELRRIAGNIMSKERPGHTLQPTILATEAWFNLTDHNARNWQNRAHFFAVAARAMRRVLVDYGRRKRSLKRGGALARIELDTPVAMQTDLEDVLALDEALTRLERQDARQCRIVEMRYFGGLTEEETAEVLGISPRTVKREWSVAKAWLYAELGGNRTS